jgi:hypothetical protein
LRQVQHRKDKNIMAGKALFVNNTIVGFTGRCMSERDNTRGHDDARTGKPFEPSAYKYPKGSRAEYDYALGYAEVNDVRAATDVIDIWDMEHALPKSRPIIYEEDGQVVRARPRC